jgi:hypothetical protein
MLLSVKKNLLKTLIYNIDGKWIYKLNPLTPHFFISAREGE